MGSIYWRKKGIRPRYSSNPIGTRKKAFSIKKYQKNEETGLHLLSLHFESDRTELIGYKRSSINRITGNFVIASINYDNTAVPLTCKFLFEQIEALRQQPEVRNEDNESKAKFVFSRFSSSSYPKINTNAGTGNLFHQGTVMVTYETPYATGEIRIDEIHFSKTNRYVRSGTSSDELSVTRGFIQTANDSWNDTGIGAQN